MTTISIATRCPDTKWISRLLNLSLESEAHSACVFLGAIAHRGWFVGWGTWDFFPGPSRVQRIAMVGEETFLTSFTSDPEERINSR